MPGSLFRGWNSRSWGRSLVLLGVGGLTAGAADPVKVGSGYVQTRQDPDKVRVNPRPFFVDSASVTDALKRPGTYGTMVDRLHSWAGWVLWGNNTREYRTFGTDRKEARRDKLVQGPIFMGPLALKYVDRTRGSSTRWGEWPGLLFSTPVGSLAMWQPGYALPNASQTYGLVQTGAFYPLLRAYPAAHGEDDAPSWQADNLVGDRLGDFDLQAVLVRPAAVPTAAGDPPADPAPPETIRLSVAQGSPFAWFEHTGWGDDAGMNFVAKADGFIKNRDLGFIDLAAEAATVDPALGCGVIEVKEKVLAGYDPLGEHDNLTVYRHLAVFYDTATTTAAPVGTATQTGLFLKPKAALAKGAAWRYVVAALPVVEYPGNDAGAPTQAEARQNAKAWAQALAPYAFNRITGTAVTYQVEHGQGTLATTYTATTERAGPVGAAAGAATVLCLMPHHTEDFKDGQGRRVFAGDLDAVRIRPAGNGPFLGRIPTGHQGHMPFWTALGNLTPVQGNGFTTRYVLAHVLPFLPPVPYVATGAGSTTAVLQTINQMEAREWIHMIEMQPPANTQLNGGPQTGLYGLGGALKRLTGPLPLLKTQKEKKLVNDSPANSKPKSTTGSGWAFTVDQKYDGTKMLDFHLQGVHDFFDLMTRETPTMKWGRGGDPGTQPNADSSAHFFYDGDLGALLSYPTNTALVCASGCANTGSSPGGGLFWIAQPLDLAGEVQDAYQLNSHFCDYHYNYGWITMAASQAAWMSPHGSTNADRFAKDKFGTLIDQMVMTIVHDPAIQARTDLADDQKFWTVPGFQYPKLSFFDQWSGQGWVDGVPQAGATGDGANGDWNGKNENSFGEAYQMWSSVALWGMASGRQPVADLGLYLATTALYNYAAYWGDHLQMRVPEDPAGRYVPGKAQWSARGDWIPSSNFDKAGANVWGSDRTFFSDWWYWGNTASTRDTKGQAAAYAVKLQQGQVIQQSMFGQSNPLPTVFNLWFPQGGHTLDFVRGAGFQTGIVDLLNTADPPDHGWPLWHTSSDERIRISTLNQMRALLGLGKVYRDPRQALKDVDKAPWAWIYDQLKTGDPGLTWPTFVREFMDDRQSVAELLNFFWVTENYGTPDPTIFGHSKDVDEARKGGSTHVQPTGAAFVKKTKAGDVLTLVAFNPNPKAYKMDFWRLGADTSKAGLADVPFEVPPNWVQVRTLPAAHR